MVELDCGVDSLGKSGICRVMIVREVSVSVSHQLMLEFILQAMSIKK